LGNESWDLGFGIWDLEFKSIMKKKNVKKALLKLAKSENREQAKEQGYYNGRFRERVVPDKKKKASKEAARREEIDLEN
jgi:uncharacterized protein YueI